MLPPGLCQGSQGIPVVMGPGLGLSQDGGWAEGPCYPRGAAQAVAGELNRISSAIFPSAEAAPGRRAVSHWQQSRHSGTCPFILSRLLLLLWQAGAGAGSQGRVLQAAAQLVPGAALPLPLPGEGKGR